MEYKYLRGKNDIMGYKNILVVDINPKKACNFNCVFCPIGETDKWLNKRKEFFPVDEIFNEINNFVQENKEVTGTMLTRSGEPALYKSFGKLAMRIREKYPEFVIMAYTNASLLHLKEVQEEFSLCNVIGCNLNSTFNNEFQKISRPHSGVILRNILDGLLEFSKHFRGILRIDTKFLPELNDTEKNIDGLLDYLRKVQPNTYTVIGRKHKGKQLSKEFSGLIREKMNDLPFPTQLIIGD